MAVLVLVFLIPLIQFAHAGTYVGMNQNQGAATPCAGCDGTGPTFTAIGGVGQAPFTGTLSSVTIFTLSNLPTQVLISSFGANKPATDTCSAFGGVNCVSGSQTSTLLDVEGLSGLSTNTFTTITLANPPSVTIGTWISVSYMLAGGAALGSVINFCNQSPVCTPGGVPSNFIPCMTIQYLSTTPTVGNTFSTVDSSVNGCSGPGIMGETFSPSGSQVTTVDQCYGNCGSPAITLVNTNSTHLTNFNQSITLFYEFQSNLNGFILNASINFAKSYAGTSQVGFLAVYTISSCPVGQTPFSSACPGLQKVQFNGGPPPKGRFTLQISLGSIPVYNGQWVAVGFSCLFSPCDLNDTNTNVPEFQTNGVTPSTISSSATTTCTCKTGAWLFIRGNVVTGGGPSTPPTGCSSFATIDCWLPALINGQCLVVTPSCQAASGLLWASALSLICLGIISFIFGKAAPGVRIPFGEIFMVIFLAWIFMETGLSLIFIWVPVFFFFIAAIIFSKHTGRYF